MQWTVSIHTLASGTGLVTASRSTGAAVSIIATGVTTAVAAVSTVCPPLAVVGRTKSRKLLRKPPAEESGDPPGGFSKDVNTLGLVFMGADVM